MANKSVKEVTVPEFAALVAGKRPVLADCYGTWCGPCKAMGPIVERLAERFNGRAGIVKVNIDESPDLAAAHGVRGVPTFLPFVGGKAIGRVVGAHSERALAALIGPHLIPARAAARLSRAA